MLEAVPARVVGRIAQPEVGTLVDDRRAGGDEVGDELRRGAVREGEEDRIRGRHVGMDVEVERGQVGMDAGDRIVVAAPPDEPDQLDVRMPREQPNELATDIAGRPDDPDPDHARIVCRLRDSPWNSRVVVMDV